MLNPQMRLKAARYSWLVAKDHWDAWGLYSARERYLAAIRVAERALARLRHARAQLNSGGEKHG